MAAGPETRPQPRPSSATAGRGLRPVGAGPEDGHAVLEFAIFLPFLVMVFLGMVDICILLGQQINLIHLGREAASALSRGSTMQETLDAITAADGSLELDGGNGRIILTQITRPAGGTAVIVGQQAAGGLAVPSQVGTLPAGEQEAPATIPNGMVLPEDMNLAVVELYSDQTLFGGPESSGTLANITLSSLAAF